MSRLTAKVHFSSFPCCVLLIYSLPVFLAAVRSALAASGPLGEAQAPAERCDRSWRLHGCRPPPARRSPQEPRERQNHSYSPLICIPLSSCPGLPSPRRRGPRPCPPAAAQLGGTGCRVPAGPAALQAVPAPSTRGLPPRGVPGIRGPEPPQLSSCSRLTNEKHPGRCPCIILRVQQYERSEHQRTCSLSLGHDLRFHCTWKPHRPATPVTRLLLPSRRVSVGSSRGAWGELRRGPMDQAGLFPL